MARESTPLIEKLSDSCSPNTGSGKKNEWSFEESSTLLVYSAENPSIKKAAYLLRDAIILAKSTSPFAHTDYLISSKSGEDADAYAQADGSIRMFRRILLHPLVGGVLRLCIFGLVMLSFLEPPSWCRGFGDGDSNTMNGCATAMSIKGVPLFYSDDSEEQIQDYYPNTGTTRLTVGQSLYLEWFFVAMLLLHTVLCLGKDNFSMENYFYLNAARLDLAPLTARRIRTAAIFRYVRVLTLILLVKGMVGFSLLNPERTFATLLRIILFISYSEGIQSEILIVMEIIPALATVALVLAMVIAFYGLIGVAAFYNTSEGTLHFSNFIEGVWSLFTSMTTVIYPDVMMAGYNDNRFVALYFVSFMMLTFFFFQNVILGLIVNIYNNSHEAKGVETDQAREDLCEKAFGLLTGGDVDYVTRQQLMAVFLILNDDCDEIEYVFT